VFAQEKPGLGTGSVKALAQRLGAKLITVSGRQGTSVWVIHAIFPAKEIRAAKQRRFVSQ
jgi:chemotaxis protein methyltransferase CheR